MKSIAPASVGTKVSALEACAINMPWWLYLPSRNVYAVVRWYTVQGVGRYGVLRCCALQIRIYLWLTCSALGKFFCKSVMFNDEQAGVMEAAVFNHCSEKPKDRTCEPIAAVPSLDRMSASSQQSSCHGRGRNNNKVLKRRIVVVG